MAWARTAEAEAWKRTFGERLRTLRLGRGLSQMDLAHLSNMDPTYISGVEQGRRNISLVNIHALAGALEVPVAVLFADPDGND